MTENKGLELVNAINAEVAPHRVLNGALAAALIAEGNAARRADEKTPGQIAYEAHWTVEGKCFGDWETTGKTSRDGWEQSAAAISAPLLERIAELEKIVGKLPKTIDGKPVVIGAVLVCPNGHETEILRSSRISGQIYCCQGKCYWSGCQGSSGGGTYYDAAKCSERK